ncbi:MAG TPA: hypothetical protein VH044_07330 [Polyangiaceae bacterium]|jgi:hypothetical protein|nr:hypothetical protein [Polyangiaceae bacterium]
MARDSLFGERIVWQGRCRAVTVPFTQKVLAAVAAVLSAVSLCYAVVIAESLDVPVGGMVLFAAWCASLALGAWRLPLWWRSQLEYIVTDRHVICRRGRIRRSIETKQISYGLVRWSTTDTGDLVLVRAVPTGALRRTLSLTLHDVEAPDRLWAIIRGVEPSAPLGSGDRPLGQRLDVGERVLWSAAPMASTWTTKRVVTAVTGAILAFTFERSLAKSVPSLAQVLRMHELPTSLAVLLVGAVALGMSLLLAISAGAGYAALVRPTRLARETRYFVTNARVLIRRGNEELTLDRSRIAYVIDAPSRKLHDVFLVLDGPQARALAPSGAFGGNPDDGALRPVFAAIEDADTVGRILRA